MSELASQRRVGRNATALLLVQVANYAVPFLAMPYLTATLGVAGYGLVAMGMSLAAIGLVVTGFGFARQAWKKIA